MSVIMAERKRRQPRQPNRTDDVLVNFYTSKELVDQFEAFLGSLPPDRRPSKKAVLETALMNYLAAQGFWPPRRDRHGNHPGGN